MTDKVEDTPINAPEAEAPKEAVDNRIIIESHVADASGLK